MTKLLLVITLASCCQALVLKAPRIRLAAQMQAVFLSVTLVRLKVQVHSACKVRNWDTYRCFCPVTRDSLGSEASAKGPLEETSCEPHLSLTVSIFLISAPCTKSEVAPKLGHSLHCNFYTHVSSSCPRLFYLDSLLHVEWGQVRILIRVFKTSWVPLGEYFHAAQSFPPSNRDSSSLYSACYCGGLWRGWMQLWSWWGVAEWWSRPSPAPHRLGPTPSSAHVEQRPSLPPLSCFSPPLISLEKVSLGWAGAWFAPFHLGPYCPGALFQLRRFYSCVAFFIIIFWADFSILYLYCFSCTLWTLVVQYNTNDSQCRVN